MPDFNMFCFYEKDRVILSVKNMTVDNPETQERRRREPIPTIGERSVLDIREEFRTAKTEDLTLQDAIKYIAATGFLAAWNRNSAIFGISPEDRQIIEPKLEADGKLQLEAEKAIKTLLEEKAEPAIEFFYRDLAGRLETTLEFGGAEEKGQSKVKIRPDSLLMHVSSSAEELETWVNARGLDREKRAQYLRDASKRLLESTLTCRNIIKAIDLLGESTPDEIRQTTQRIMASAKEESTYRPSP